MPVCVYVCVRVCVCATGSGHCEGCVCTCRHPCAYVHTLVLQVLRIAEEAINGDISGADLPHALSNSRFWLFIKDNVHRSLHEGYVEVVNTVVSSLTLFAFPA